jgi:predicted MFS family arabinose efflux permease
VGTIAAVSTGSSVGRGQWLMLASLTMATFVVYCNNLIIGPLIVELSQAFRVGVAEVGQLVGAYALPSAAVALVSGPLLDLHGRRRILVGGLVLVALSTLGCALIDGLPSMLVLRVLAGIGGAAIWPAAIAAIGDIFPYRQRAWAMGWLLGINALVPALGVPAETLIAQRFGWRMAFFAVASLVAVAAVALAATLPRTTPRTALAISYLATYRDALRHVDVLAMIGYGVLSHVFWHAALTYAPSFYQLTYGLTVGELAPILAAVGFAGIVGNFAGGRAAGRLGSRPVAVVSLLSIALLLPAQMGLGLPMLAALGLHLAWSVPNGARGPAANALLTEVLPERRGTVISLNSAASSLGVFLGASLGGLVVGTGGGFAGLGILCSVLAIGCACVIWSFIRERA